MPEKRNDGGPAFPQFYVVAGDRDGHGDAIEAYTIAIGGMSLRDWVAGQALLGILSGPASREGVPMSEWFDAPEQAYRLADAMLVARSK